MNNNNNTFLELKKKKSKKQHRNSFWAVTTCSLSATKQRPSESLEGAEHEMSPDRADRGGEARVLTAIRGIGADRPGAGAALCAGSVYVEQCSN